LTKKYGPLVEIASIKHVSDYLRIDQKKNYTLEGAKIAIQSAFKEANVTLDDLDFAEVHDCFTIAEILIYEAMGLAKDGEGYKVIDEGTVLPEGKLPVNLSRWVKSKGPSCWSPLGYLWQF